MKKIIFCLTLPVFLAGCGGPRMTIVTGTAIGLHVTPGNANNTPPQVSLAYKRMELAVIPTARNGAIISGTNVTDAYSSLAGFDFRSSFFGRTSLQEFISTGFASRNLLDNPGFTDVFGK